MCSKTIYDCVEAIIEAYYVGGGLRAAMVILNWLRIEVEIEEDLVMCAILSASMHTYLPKVNEIEMLEAKLGYAFSVKGLLIETLTHSSPQESGARYCYRVLNDIVESTAGAILIDTKLDLDVVWGVFKPLLTPIVTPENRELAPFRELLEWCDKNGYFVGINCRDQGDKIMATLDVQLKEILLVRQGCGKNIEDAKAHAASLLLKDLEEKRLLIPKDAGRTKQFEKQCGSADRSNNFLDVTDTQIPKPTRVKELAGSRIAAGFVLDKPVHAMVKMSKGGPRVALFELCKKDTMANAFV